MVILKSWVILDHPGVILGHPWIILCHLGVILGWPGSSEIFPAFYWLALRFLSFYHFISSRLSWDLTIVSATDVRILNEIPNKKRHFQSWPSFYMISSQRDNAMLDEFCNSHPSHCSMVNCVECVECSPTVAPSHIIASPRAESALSSRILKQTIMVRNRVNTLNVRSIKSMKLLWLCLAIHVRYTHSNNLRAILIRRHQRDRRDGELAKSVKT